MQVLMRAKIINVVALKNVKCSLFKVNTYMISLSLSIF